MARIKCTTNDVTFFKTHRKVTQCDGNEVFKCASLHKIIYSLQDLRHHFPALTPGQTSHLLKRLRTHGLVKKVGKCYKYYLAKFGNRLIATILKLRETIIIRVLAGQSALVL